MMKFRLLFLFTASFLFSFSQKIDFDLLEGMSVRSIGPAAMSGRVSCIEVSSFDKNSIYIGIASVGVWHSSNGGMSWEPIFDDQPTQNIGAIALSPVNPDLIWAGTGEGNPRNSQNSGVGVFKSIDGGRTWSFKGLPNS